MNAAAPSDQGDQTLSKQTFTYKKVDDCEIKADVYGPGGNQRRPGILWIHGGALIGGSRTGLGRDQLQRYLSAGYIVVSIDYRLAPETKFKGIIEDLQDAYQWVRTKGPDLFQIDPDRLAVIGHSAGGYLTLMSGFCLSPRPKALVPFYGYGDIVGEWYSRPDPFYNRQPAVPKDEAYQAVGKQIISEGSGGKRFRFYLYCRQQGLWPKEVAGLDPEKDPSAFDRFCPVRNVTAEYPPALLLHGDQDTDVPYQQSVLMADELKRLGVEHELITMKGRGHGFDGGRDGMKDPEISATFDRVVAFLDKHLK
ncbi:MAG: alpha/beta hydrolase [Verrucomicrobia bacterium]|nr:alpha/beta hydrolase [Verrucomicrobiota bacterium]